MGATEFNLQQDGTASTSNLFAEVRKPSKIRLVLGILLLVFVVIAIVFIVLYVNEKNNNDDFASVGQQGGKEGSGETTTPRPKTTASSGGRICQEPSCVLSAGAILQKLDTSVKPCDDFYQYSCGGFVTKNYIPDNDGSLNSFSLVGNVVKNQLRALLEDEELIKNNSKDPNSAVSKAFSYYKSCMNTTQIEKVGNAVVLNLVQNHGSCPLLNATWNETHWGLERTLGRVMGELGIGVFVWLDVTPSIFNTAQRVLAVGGGVSGLGESSSRNDADQQKRIVKGYTTFAVKVFQLLGSDRALLDDRFRRMIIMEGQFLQKKGNLLAEAAVKGYDKVIDKMTLAQLNNFTGFKFNWTTYVNEALSVAGRSIEEDHKLLVALPENLKNIVDLIVATPKSTLANEICWNIIKNRIIAMPKAYRDLQDDYTAIITGTKIPTSRWKSCGQVTNKNFEYATTLLYANRHLSEEARKRAADLFTEIRNQFIQGLQEQTWMDDATRNQARIKLDAMKQSIGYPAFIKDQVALDKVYQAIHVDPHNMFQNDLNIAKAHVIDKINEIDTPPDDNKFPQPPVGVNAFYLPQANKMTVLVGMLNEPFYGTERLKAINYGAVGVIIGHEITHGFDVSGSQFDEKGNVRRWWTKQSYDKYQQRSRCVAEQYNNTYVYGRKLDGLKTLTENVADNGGLKYAYRAYKRWREVNGDEDKLPGLEYDNDQLFFIGFAQTWCAKYREEFITYLLKKDTHSLNPARVRVPISNFPEFSKAFNCEKPKKTCTVW